MKNKNLRCLENYTEGELSFLSFSLSFFLLGLFGLIGIVILGIYNYTQNPTNFDLEYYIRCTLIMLLSMTPFIIVLIISKLERSDIAKKYKLFDKLLADHILSSLLADKELINDWSLFQKTVLLRIKELVDDGQIYKFNIYDEFISELIEYKNDKEKEIIEQEVEMEVKEKNIRKEQLENEKAADLLDKYRNRDRI